MPGTKWLGTIASVLFLEGAARNCEATDLTSLRTSVQRRVRMERICVVGAEASLSSDSRALRMLPGTRSKLGCRSSSRCTLHPPSTSASPTLSTPTMIIRLISSSHRLRMSRCNLAMSFTIRVETRSILSSAAAADGSVTGSPADTSA